MSNNNELINASVEHILQATPTIKIFRLNLGKSDFHFKPGQWIDLYAPIAGKNIGGYTIISSPRERTFIDLAIKESQNHPVTVYLHQKVKTGDVLKISQGDGNFFLPEDLANSSLTFIAGGIGITPLLSMFRYVINNPKDIRIFYSAKTGEDFLFKNELAPYTIFNTSNNGRINIDFLKKHNVDLNSHFFICGPRPMIDNLTKELKAEGVVDTKIHFEKWW